MDADVKQEGDVRERLLSAVLTAMDEASSRPMQWGIDDCGTWVAGPLRAVLGYDIAADFRGRYTTREQANALFGKTGLLGALRRVGRRHRWRQVKPCDANVGDVGLAILPTGTGQQKTAPSCMICRAPGWFVGRSENGFTALRAEFVARAWSII